MTSNHLETANADPATTGARPDSRARAAPGPSAGEPSPRKVAARALAEAWDGSPEAQRQRREDGTRRARERQRGPVPPWLLVALVAAAVGGPLMAGQSGGGPQTGHVAGPASDHGGGSLAGSRLWKASATPATRVLPDVVVHKSPTCGCCGAWVTHLREAGFRVEVHDTADLEPLKTRLGVPPGKRSCHTAQVGGLVIEGHVPAADIMRLLAAGDDARGLLLPGMPIGSPGMEMPDGRVERYTVERLEADGTTSAFATHGDR